MAKKESKKTKQTTVGLEHLLRDPEATFEEILPGVEILDRELEFDDGSRADLAAVDGAGRLVLCLFAGDDPDRSALEVLDTLAFVTRNTPLLARHLASARIQPDLDPRVLVVVDPGDARLIGRLTRLAGNELELYEVRTVKSSSGERAYLVPVEGHAGGGSPAPTASPASFVESLPTALAETGRLLVERMARLDDELVSKTGRDAVTWSFRDRVLARIERVGDHLQGGLGAGEEPQRIETSEDVGRFLEAALGHLVELLGEAKKPPFPGGALRPPGGPQRELDGGSILTPEEIEAFRE
ncbi:MAG: hypothetical protein O7B99_12555 [Planctomycetota bacterium]|nr:hypothetical protein [Planctomycetota bacterium]